MPRRIFKRIVAQLFVGACAVVFGAGVLIVPGQAQFAVPPPPPPVFNPSPPNTTVPQPSYTPLSPSTPSTVPESSVPESTVPGPEVTSPVNGLLPRTAVRSHERTSVAKTRSVHHRGRSIVAPPPPASYSYYYSPFGYGCAWRRSWDGYWYRTWPCF
jgi:hypothetical protein